MVGATATTGGIANPVLSFLEDVTSLVLSVVAIVLPILAFLLIVLFAVLIVLLFRRLRRRRAGA